MGSMGLKSRMRSLETNSTSMLPASFSRRPLKNGASAFGTPSSFFKLEVQFVQDIARLGDATLRHVEIGQRQIAIDDVFGMRYVAVARLQPCLEFVG